MITIFVDSTYVDAERSKKTQKNFMTIGYNKIWGYLFVILSLIAIAIFGLGMYMDVNVPILNFVPAVICLIMGVLYLQNDYFEIRGQQFIHYSLFGTVHKTYGFKSLSDFYLDGKKLYLNSDGNKERVRISVSMCDKNDWNYFLKRVEQSDSGHGLED